MHFINRWAGIFSALSVFAASAGAQQPTPPDTTQRDTLPGNPTPSDTTQRDTVRRNALPSDTTQRDTVRRDSVTPEIARRSVQLHAVTITAAPTDRAEASNATHVSQSEIQQTPASNPWDLLRQTAGVEVHLQGQGPGFASDASVRGFSSDHSTDLALWIDGVPINEPVNGHAEGYNDWSLIFPGAVRDVDVIKGPTSALFGNFALAGVVNVRTLERTTTTSADLTGGNFGRGEASLVTGFDHGTSGGGVFGLRGSHENGFRPNGKNDLTQAHGRLVRDLSPSATIDAGVELYGARWDSPGYLSEDEFALKQYDIVSNPTDGGYKQRAQERLSLRVTRGDNLLWRTTGYATQGRWQLFLTIPPAGGKFEGTGSQTEEEDRRYGLGLTSAVSYASPIADVTFGGEGRFDNASYENWFTTARQRDSSAALLKGRQLSGGLFVQSALDVSRFMRIDLGARYDAIRTTSIPLGPEQSLEATHGVFSPKAGALLHLTPALGLYGNVSKGFRSTNGVIEDPTLVPIVVWAYESGLKLDNRAVSASVDVFRMNVSNEQTFNPLTSGSFSGGSSRRQGVELDVRAPVASVATLSTQWTLNDARYTDQILVPEDPAEPPSDVSGLRVYNTARYIGAAALDLMKDDGVTPGKWNFRLGGNWVGPYSPFDEPGVVLGSYGLMHVSGRVRLSRAAVIDGGVRNLFDRAYPEVVAGHIVAPGEPRSVYLSLRYQL
ncbi:MAG: TonB-dependent receptor [Gemmatimonadaceae bacterium]